MVAPVEEWTAPVVGDVVDVQDAGAIGRHVQRRGVCGQLVGVMDAGQDDARRPGKILRPVVGSFCYRVRVDLDEGVLDAGAARVCVAPVLCPPALEEVDVAIGRFGSQRPEGRAVLEMKVFVEIKKADPPYAPLRAEGPEDMEQMRWLRVMQCVTAARLGQARQQADALLYPVGEIPLHERAVSQGLGAEPRQLRPKPF